MDSNKITSITRRNISDELSVSELWYNGNLYEPDFLNRLFDLKSLSSRDYRYDNAYDDIYKHMVMNRDWEDGWVFTDTRFNLMHCEDKLFLNFLAETLHPAVRNDEKEILQIQEIYNRHLEADGFEIIETSAISGRPVFSGREIIIGQSHLISKKTEITKYLNTVYVRNKINLMTESVSTDTDLAIGTAKELIETICKSILRQNSIEYDKEWTIGKLLKETNNVLDFSPKLAGDSEIAERSMKKIIGGISLVIQGITELRNAFGSGHGKDANFISLEPKYAKLIVGTAAELAIFYLATNGEDTELVD